MTPRPSLFLRVITLAIVLLTAAVVRADQADTLFIAAVKAFRAGQWSQAASMFERVRAMKPNESGRVQISGNDVVEYLPSFYLGQALLEMKNCPGALEAWGVAEQVQGVKSDRGMMRTIADGRKKCPATAVNADDPAFTKALNDAEAAEKEATAAQQGFNQAIGAAGDSSPAAKAVAPQHDQATKTLQSASAQLNQARQQKNASAAQGAAGGFRTASRQFGDAQKELQRIVAEASTRYEAARATAQTAINDAADAERRAVTGKVPDSALQPGRTQLTQARAAFDTATKARDADGMQNAQKLSAASRDAFTAAMGAAQSNGAALGAARNALGQAQSSQARFEKLLAGKQPSAAVTTAIQSVARAAQGLSAPNPSAADISAASTAATSARDTLDRESNAIVTASVAATTAKLDGVVRALDRADTTSRNPDVHITADEKRQVGDARGRVEKVRHDVDQARTARDPAALGAVDKAADDIAAQVSQLTKALESRLASATGIPPELMTAAREFFAGRYDSARAAIDRVQAGDQAAAIRLQVALFRAAIVYGLYVRGGERDAALKQAAATSAAECRRLVPSYTPDPRAFSPRFVKFYNGS